MPHIGIGLSGAAAFAAGTATAHRDTVREHPAFDRSMRGAQSAAKSWPSCASQPRHGARPSARPRCARRAPAGRSAPDRMPDAVAMKLRSRGRFNVKRVESRASPTGARQRHSIARCAPRGTRVATTSCSAGIAASATSRSASCRCFARIRAHDRATAASSCSPAPTSRRCSRSPTWTTSMSSPGLQRGAPIDPVAAAAARRHCAVPVRHRVRGSGPHALARRAAAGVPPVAALGSRLERPRRSPACRSRRRDRDRRARRTRRPRSTTVT